MEIGHHGAGGVDAEQDSAVETKRFEPDLVPIHSQQVEEKSVQEIRSRKQSVQVMLRMSLATKCKQFFSEKL